MTKHRKPQTPPHERPYKVGYCKPDPKAGFQPGQVANPKGRPRKKGLRDQLDGVLNRKVTIREGDRVVKITVFQAMLQVQANNALKGDPKAVSILTRLDSQLPQTTTTQGETASLDPEDKQILEEWARKVLRDSGEGES